ncbi:transcriptional regulator [Bacteroidia bacterium]|nr:transcriptional regulator [Bacteroidia bacterium]GHT85600.1 transcriptional regulator [Bacteroidia bacterium]GHU82252.1 transcriptional regulator [Bacteroidia bacterium]
MVLQLTKAEEQVMKILWSIEQGTVQDMLERFEPPKPARTTVATILSILENKGFVQHENGGKANIYSPLMKKKEYSKFQLSGVMKNYFDNSFASMASFFAKENNLSLEELDSLLEETREALRKEKIKK